MSHFAHAGTDKGQSEKIKLLIGNIYSQGIQRKIVSQPVLFLFFTFISVEIKRCFKAINLKG